MTGNPPEEPISAERQDRGVHLAFILEPHLQKQVAGLNPLTVNPGSLMDETVGLGVSIIGAAAAIFVLRTFSIEVALMTAGVAMGVTIVWLIVFAIRIRRASRVPHSFSPVSDPRHRVRVVGSIRLLEKLRRSRISLDAGFEPRIFRIGSAVEKAGAARLKLLLLVPAGIGVVVLGEYLATGAVRHYYVELMFGAAVGRFSRAYVWPTYLRVTPGRLDVLQYPFLGAGKPRLRSYDLRRSRVAVAIHGPMIVFGPAMEDGELFPAATHPWTEEEPLIFERAILAGALTRIESPGLPEDELIG